MFVFVFVFYHSLLLLYLFIHINDSTEQVFRNLKFGFILFYIQWIWNQKYIGFERHTTVLSSTMVEVWKTFDSTITFVTSFTRDLLTDPPTQNTLHIETNNSIWFVQTLTLTTIGKRNVQVSQGSALRAARLTDWCWAWAGAVRALLLLCPVWLKCCSFVCIRAATAMAWWGEEGRRDTDSLSCTEQPTEGATSETQSQVQAG